MSDEKKDEIKKNESEKEKETSTESKEKVEETNDGCCGSCS